MKYYVKECPHCGESILLYHHELNCKIYRHGVFKNTSQQMNPHSSKEECDYYIKHDMIYGCGKPFKIEFTENDDISLVKCDYI
jgi:hypothetical protein